MAGSSADSNRLYASQSNGWFGQLMQRSDDGGKTWGTGRQRISLRWHTRYTNGLTARSILGVQTRLAFGAFTERPDTVYAGVEDAALFLFA